MRVGRDQPHAEASQGRESSRTRGDSFRRSAGLLHVTAEFGQTGDPYDPLMRVAIGPSASRCSHGSPGQLRQEEEKLTADWQKTGCI